MLQKRGGEIPVDLPCDDMTGAGGKRERQRAASGSDLEKRIVGAGIDGTEDLLDPGALEKILSEPFSR